MHRLRASLPSKLWRWRDVVGWRWKGGPEHINALELRAVKTSLIWRIKGRKLRRTLAKIGALLLASGSVGAWFSMWTRAKIQRIGRRGGRPTRKSRVKRPRK